MWSWPTDPLYFDTTELYQSAKFSLWLIVTAGTAILGLRFVLSEIRRRLASTNPTARTRYGWSVFYISYRAT
jgi:hypothetical protein